MTSVRALRAPSTAVGLVMVAAAALRADDLGLLAASIAVVSVVAAIQFHWAATLAVLCCVMVLTLSDGSPVQCALAGFAATLFLILGRAVPPEPIPLPTIVALLAATSIALVATTVPVELPWAPLAAPPAVLVAFVVTVQAVRRRVRTAATRPARSLRKNFAGE